MKSFLISLGGDKAGEVVDILTHYAQPSELKGSVNVEVFDTSGKNIDAEVIFKRGNTQNKFETKEGRLKIGMDENYDGVEIKKPGFIPAYKDFNFEKSKNYTLKATLGRRGTDVGNVFTLMLTISSPLIWAGLKFAKILPYSKYVFTAAVMLSIVELIGALFGLLTLGKVLQNQLSLSKFGNLARSVSITLGAYFAIIPFTYLKLGNVLSGEDIVIIAALTVVLASLGIILEDKLLANIRINRKILKASFGAGIGTLIGGLTAYYVLSKYTSILNGVNISKNILIFLPFIIAVFSIFWGYLIIEALKIESRDVAVGLVSVLGVLIISSTIILLLHSPQLLIPFVVPCVVGSMLGFLLLTRIPEAENSYIEILLEKTTKKRYKYSVESIAVDTSETRLNRLKFVENKIPIPLTSETCDEIIDFLRLKITKTFEKIMEECSRFFDNFILFIDLRGGELCECTIDIIKMLKNEFEIPVYVFVISSKDRINTEWLKNLAKACDAVFPVDYTLFEENIVIEVENEENKIIEEGCVAEVIRRLAPILEVGDRTSPSGADVSHVIRTLNKNNTRINTGCEIVDCDVLPTNDVNVSTISYFRVSVDACQDVNFEAEFVKYLNFAIKNNLWKFNVNDVNNERTRSMLILRGRREALKTHMAKSRFNKIFRGLVINVSDLLDDDSPYLEIIILCSNVNYNPPNSNSVSCSEGHHVVPQEKEVKTKKEFLFIDDGEDRVSSKGFPPEKFVEIIREHYSKPLIRNFAVKIAKKHPGATNWMQAKDIYEWVRDNISYVCDPTDREYVQYPEETLESMGGDCDDQAILLASLLLAVGFRTCLIFVPNHVYVAAYIPDAPEDVRTFEKASKKDGTNWYDWIGMDPTCTSCEFGELPEGDYKIECAVDIV